jgi:hypothetical protein
MELVNDWDFLRVMPLGFPKDEYDCIVGSLLSKLQQGASEEEIAKFVDQELRNHYGLREPSGIPEFSRRVVRWFRSEAAKNL